MANSSFFKSDGQTTTLQTNLEDKAADAEKLAINPEDDQFTLSDGTTTGYSALHHKEKALDAQTASEAARDASQAARDLSQTYRNTAEDHKDDAESAKVAAEAAKVAAETAETNAETAETNAQASEDEAEAWASKTDGEAVTGEGYSAKAHAVGGTGVTNSTGAAKEWATKAEDSTVDGSEYSAKHYSAKASASASTASTKASEASTSAAAAAASQTAAAASAASAASTYDQFDDRYLGVKSSDPTVDNDGNALVEGALYFSSTDNAMQVYDGSAWIAASSAGNVSITEYHYTATANQTAFSGSGLSYTVDNLVVIMNGVILQNGSSKDFTATDGTTVTLTSAASAGDELHVIVFKSFTTADMVSKTNGGAYSGSVDFTGGLEINGTAVTATAAELNTLDGITATTSELNTLDGVTATASEINTLDGITATTAELNLLDGVTATTAELNYVDGVTSNIQTQIDNISTDVVSDTSPSLGGDLDAQQNDINNVNDLEVEGQLTTGGASTSIGGTTFNNVFKADTTHRAVAFVSDQANSGASVWWADETQAPVCAIDGNNGGGMGLWVNNGSTWNNTVYLNNSNRVGIQNTNPQQTLDVTGVIRANNASDFVGTTSGATALEVFQPTAQKDAALVFHVAGDFAAYLGLDGAKNDLFYGGWSEGANKYTVLHEKNTPNRVVQVKTQNFGPARQTISGATPVQITGSNISFTPKYSNSKILISCNFTCTSSYVMSWGFYNGSSALQSTSGYTNNNQPGTWNTFYDGNNNHGIIEDHHMQGVFNAGSTSTRTYNVRATSGWSGSNGYTIYVNNRGSNDMAGLGNITVMEIAQ